MDFLLVPGARAQDWQLVHSADRLQVQRRNYEGSELDEIRGVIAVEASLNAVMALLKDDAFNDQWVYRSGGAEILREDGYASAYVYGVVDAPWPMLDRDTIVRFDYRQDPLTREIVITITNAPDFIPARENLVRVPDFGGFWKLRPQAGGRVEVIYQVYGDPGGLVPVWLANFAAQRSVIRTLQNLGPAVARYAGAHSPFVQELAAD